MGEGGLNNAGRDGGGVKKSSLWSLRQKSVSLRSLQEYLNILGLYNRSETHFGSLKP